MNRLNQLLNVSTKEWPRILVAWSLVFFNRMGFIIGWTILLTAFLSRIGIEYLPLLYLTNAILVMGGTLVYRRFIHKIKRELLLTYTILVGTTLFITAAAFMANHTIVFFTLFLIAQGIFMSQVSILIVFFNDELFSPLESQRTFPIIESAETLGGILGGLILTFFSHNLPPYKFIVLGVLLLLLMLPIILKCNSRTLDVPQLEIDPQAEPRSNKKLHNTFKKLKKVPFIKGLMIVIFLHWGMMNIVEFQSMKAIQQNVYSTEEHTLVETPSDQNIMLAEETLHEENLTQKLGTLHLIFFSTIFLIQLIFASRILSNLGDIPTMMIHAILTLLNAVGMSLHFNLVTASLSRGSYELTGILFKNAFDNSTYVIDTAEQEDAKEVIQGLLRPLGAIVGNLSLFLIALRWEGLTQTLIVNSLIIMATLSMLWVLKGLSKKYTELCEQNLSHKKDLPTRLNAVEILGQKGHEKKIPALQKILKRSHEPLILRENILHTLGLQEDLESIGIILEMLRHEEPKLRHSAIEALREFKDLKKSLMQQAFTKHRVVETLKEVLLSENDTCIREEALECFFQIAPEELTPFILNTIETHPEKKAAFVHMLRLFPDPNLSYYLMPLLEDSSAEVKAAAIVALWQFEPLHGTLQHHLGNMLLSKQKNKLKAALETAGYVKFKQGLPLIRKQLGNTDKTLRETALLALTQLEEREVLPNFVVQLSDPVHEWFDHSSTMLRRLPNHLQEEVRYLLHLRIIEQIHALLKKNKKLPLNQWSQEALVTLKKLYTKVSAHKEVHLLQKLLNAQ